MSSGEDSVILLGRHECDSWSGQSGRAPHVALGTHTHTHFVTMHTLRITHSIQTHIHTSTAAYAHMYTDTNTIYHTYYIFVILHKTYIHTLLHIVYFNILI